VAVCEPPEHLLVLTIGADNPSEEHAIEATLAADGDGTLLVLQERGMPLDLLDAYGPACRCTSRTSKPISPAGGAWMRRLAGTSCSRPTGSWRATSASATA
jgi:hypothetical protein